jgi:ABC-2 type transport system ATP-binding protein
MYAGRIVAEGSPADLKSQVERETGQLLEFVVDQPEPALAPLVAAGYTNAALFGTKVHVLSRDPHRDEARIRDVLSRVGVHVESMRTRTLSLEDVFVSRVVALEQAAQKESE